MENTGEILYLRSSEKEVPPKPDAMFPGKVIFQRKKMYLPTPSVGGSGVRSDMTGW